MTEAAMQLTSLVLFLRLDNERVGAVRWTLDKPITVLPATRVDVEGVPVFDFPALGAVEALPEVSR